MIRACPKPVRVIDEPHLARVRTLQCLLYGIVPHVCDGYTRFGKRGQVVVIQAAHVRGKGAGGGDEQVVPLCEEAHIYGRFSLHRCGKAAAFDKHWGTCLWRTARELYAETLRLRKAGETE